ncbi:MAG: MFS transporter [Actinobacteria bacterium]|nr:MFS transporter [Actinomycetota bacterium]
MGATEDAEAPSSAMPGASVLRFEKGLDAVSLFSLAVHGVDRKGIAALSSGHLAADLAQGALPALLPFLVVKFDLSYTMAAALVLASTISSSVIQPAFGHWSDARGALWLLPTGVAVAGVGMALAAVAPSYPLVMLAVLAAGVGVAAYHPEGSKFASYVSGARRASGMSLFSVGGNLGFATGPLLASGVIVAFGLTGGLLIALPGLAVAAMLFAALPYLSTFSPEVARDEAPAEPGQPRALTLLLAVVGLRALAHMGLFTFVPLWEIHKGHSATYGTALLGAFLFAGALGTLAAGPLADRFGRRRVLGWSFVAATPLILVYVIVGGAVGALALALSGAAVIGSFGVTLVMSQEYMPGRVGMASGLSIGFAIGLGGVAAVCLGVVADAIDLRTAVLATAAGPALGLLLTLALPPTRRPRVAEPLPASI